MRDGQYSICLSANGYSGRGKLELKANRGQGHDGRYRVELLLRGEGSTCAGIANVLMDPRTVHNSSMPSHYSLNMTGSSNGEAFKLIGVGPLGLIVQLDGELAAQAR
jgi:hypothetical protein